MKLTAFPNPMQRIAIGMPAVVLVAYLLELSPCTQKLAIQDLRSYQFEKKASYTFYMEQLAEGLTVTFTPTKADSTMDTGDTVGPDLTAPQARLRHGIRRGDVRLAESRDRNAGMSAVITPQPTYANPSGKEVAFVSGP